jgi:hypothetical protein
MAILEGRASKRMRTSIVPGGTGPCQGKASRPVQGPSFIAAGSRMIVDRK